MTGERPSRLDKPSNAGLGPTAVACPPYRESAAYCFPVAGATGAGEGVLFVGHEASRTGAPLVLLHLLRWLQAEMQLPLSILLLHGGPLVPQFQQLGPVHVVDRTVFHHQLPERLLLRAGRPSLADRLRDARLRRLFARHDGHPLVYANSAVASKVVPYLPPHGPVVCHVHELEYALRWGMPAEHLAAMLDSTDHYIAASAPVRDNLVRSHGVATDSVTVVHDFVDTGTWPPPHARPELVRREDGPHQPFTVVSCGTTDWRKGADLFLALAVLLRRRPGSDGLRLRWVGASTHAIETARMRHDVGHAGLDDVVELCGELDDPRPVVSTADVFVLLSREDPFPLAAVEAAASGVLVICFDGAGGMVDLVGDDAGVVVPYLDLTAVADAVQGLREDPERRWRLGRNAGKRARDLADVRLAGPEVLDVLHRLAPAVTTSMSPKRAGHPA